MHLAPSVLCETLARIKDRSHNLRRGYAAFPQIRECCGGGC
jgi:hypothetical protein